MRSLLGSRRTRFPVGLLLLATAATLLNMAGANIIAVEPGELQAALDKVQPGDTLKLKAGEYWETVVTKINGRADAYITIEGESDSYDAILKGDPSIDNDGRIVNIQHSYYILDGFKIDGKQSDDNFVDKCIYVQQSRDNDDAAPEIEFNGHRFRSSINGLVLSNMEVTNCGGECIRMRYFITYAQVFGNTITNCGAHDYKLGGNTKNGEGIYLGTSSNQWPDGKNPTPEDVSCYNHFFGNHFDTQGNEGIDIKEGSRFNIVEDNYCTGQKDPNSACLDARGDSNIFRYNTCEKNLGAGIRIGGHNIGGKQFGENNEVYDNILQENDYAGVKIMFGPQGAVCGNDISGSAEDAKGSAFAEGLSPEMSCDIDVAADMAIDVPPLQHDGSGTEVEDCDCDEVSRLEKELEKAKEACTQREKEGRHVDGSYGDSDDDGMDSDDYDSDDDGMESDDGSMDDDDDDEDYETRDDDDDDNDDGDDDEVRDPQADFRLEQVGDDQKCSNGLAGFEAANVCCPLWCGRCGGKGCSDVGKECCTSDVKDTKVKCSKSGSAPCIIDDASSADSQSLDGSSSDGGEPQHEQVGDAQKCSNGLPGYEAANVCCPLSCGRCGGKGCDGLGEGCCTKGVKESGEKCSETKSAPCNIDTETVDVSSGIISRSVGNAAEEERQEQQQQQEEEEEVNVTGHIAEETEGRVMREYLAKEEFEPPTVHKRQHLLL